MKRTALDSFSWIMPIILVALGYLLVVGCGGEQRSSAITVAPAPPLAMPPAPPPIIQVEGEALLMSRSNSLPLSQPVQSVTAVYSYGSDGRRIDYERGTDWNLSGNRVFRTSNSRIPDFSSYSYVRSSGDRFSTGSSPRNPPLTITFNVYIDYVSQRADPMVTARSMRPLARSLLCLGDSIAAGAHTIAEHYRGSDGESWCGLLRAYLGNIADVRNESVPGAAISGVIADIDRLRAIPAETVLIGFGTNDHVFEQPGGVEQFRRDLTMAVQMFRGMGKDVILIGFFQKNMLWELEDPAKTLSYNAAISEVARVQNVPFVDIYAAFEQRRVEGDPAFLHLTADFLHHPNNYGQRIYFSLIIPYLLSESRPASAIPGYVIGPWTS